MTPLSQSDKPDRRSAEVIAGLATLYFRYNDPARALVLGIAAMKSGAAGPRTALLVASCFLKTGDAEQAAAALEPLEDVDLTQQEAAAYKYLKAKVAFRLSDPDTARALLAEAAQIADTAQ
ncbi:MAG: hypothetical protein AAGA87_02570 [Pseudomonadota bacterium]